jgi:hypothetical protein
LSVTRLEAVAATAATAATAAVAAFAFMPWSRFTRLRLERAGFRLRLFRSLRSWRALLLPVTARLITLLIARRPRFTRFAAAPALFTAVTALQLCWPLARFLPVAALRRSGSAATALAALATFCTFAALGALAHRLRRGCLDFALAALEPAEDLADD